MRGQDNKQVQEHYALRRRVYIAKHLCNIGAGILLAIILIGLAGCAVAPQGASSGITQQHSQDLNSQDDRVVEFCQQVSIMVVSDQIKLALSKGARESDITEQAVLDAINDVFRQCMIQNGRKA